MSVEAPERIFIAPNRTYTNPWGRPIITDDFDEDGTEYIRLDKLEELAAENEHNDYMKGKWRECASSAEAAFAEAKAENERLSERVETLESFRPHWAKGYSSDSMAAQAATAALSDIWKFLRVSNQTEAMSALAEKDKEIAALNKQVMTLGVQLDDMMFLSVEGFLDLKSAHQLERARNAGGKDAE